MTNPTNTPTKRSAQSQPANLTRADIVATVHHLHETCHNNFVTARDVANEINHPRRRVGSHLRNAVARGELDRPKAGHFTPPRLAHPEPTLDIPASDVTRTIAAVDLDWMSDAACRGVGPEKFHPASAETAIPPDVVRMCAGCPVSEPCLDFGLQFPPVDPPAIYAGRRLTPRVVRRLGRERRVRPASKMGRR